MKKYISSTLPLLLICFGLFLTTSCTENQVDNIIQEQEEEQLDELTTTVEDGLEIIVDENEVYQLNLTTDLIEASLTHNPNIRQVTWQIQGASETSNNKEEFSFNLLFHAPDNEANNWILDELTIYRGDRRVLFKENNNTQINIDEVTESTVSGTVNVKYGIGADEIAIAFDLPYVRHQIQDVSQEFSLPNGAILLRLDSTINIPCRSLGYISEIPEGNTTVVRDDEKAYWESTQVMGDFSMKIAFETERKFARGTYPLTHIEYSLPESMSNFGLVDISDLPAENINLKVILDYYCIKTYSATIVGTITDLQGEEHYLEIVHNKLNYNVN